jgi:hypothetical protein
MNNCIHNNDVELNEYTSERVDREPSKLRRRQQRGCGMAQGVARANAPHHEADCPVACAGDATVIKAKGIGSAPVPS